METQEGSGPDPVSQRAEWLEARRTGLGGSDMAAVMGLRPYGRTAHDVWLEKTGKLVQPDVDSPDKRRGRIVEPILRALYAEETGRVAVPGRSMLRHEKLPYLFANPDVAIYDQPPVLGKTDDVAIVLSRPDRVGEIKSPRLHVHRRWKMEGLPGRFLIQLNTYFEVTGIPQGAFIFGNLEGMELVHFDFARDNQLVEQILTAAEHFWTKHVLADIPPPVEEVAPEIAKQLEREAPGQLVMLNSDAFREAVDQYTQAIELKKMAERMTDETKQQLVGILGGADAVQGMGFRIYNREQAGRVTFDHKGLERCAPIDRLKVAAAIVDLLTIASAGKRPGPDQVQQLSTLLDACTLDLTPFRKVGNAFRTMRVYRLAGDNANDD